MELLDQSLLKPGGLLLDEGEAKSLFEMLVNIDCFVVVKILLLLPYDAPRLQCLQEAELVLKERGVPSNHIVHEYELLTVVLSAEVMQIVIFNPAFGTVFSYMCYLVGHLARVCQEELLKHRDGKGGSPDWCWSLLFGTLLLPCFIAELVLAKQCILAGFIVSRWMHTHPSLGLIDTVQASLHKYLEGQLLRVSDPMNGDLGASCNLHGALSRLSSKLNNLLQSALSDLKPST
ncbi:hypothetical protein HPP92_002517 [Vanilla planifolia]|nr:hypothetical protein HPP92_002517 [Vanilla planifolia]